MEREAEIRDFSKTKETESNLKLLVTSLQNLDFVGLLQFGDDNLTPETPINI